LRLGSLRYAAADTKYLATAYVNLTSRRTWTAECFREVMSETATIIKKAVLQADVVRKQKQTESPIRWLETDQQQRVYAELSKWRMAKWNQLQNDANYSSANRRWIGNVMRNRDMYTLSTCTRQSDDSMKKSVYTWTHVLQDSANWAAVLKILRAG
jgi:hypothetical protein